MKKHKVQIHHPDHYNSLDAQCSHCGTRIECIDVVRNFNFNLGNVIKYIWRCDLKNEKLDDLEKALWYLKDEVNKLKMENRK